MKSQRGIDEVYPAINCYTCMFRLFWVRYANPIKFHVDSNPDYTLNKNSLNGQGNFMGQMPCNSHRKRKKAQQSVLYTAKTVLFFCIIMLFHICMTRPQWCICCVYTMVYMQCIHINGDLCVVYTSVGIYHICSMKYMQCMRDARVTHPS